MRSSPSIGRIGRRQWLVLAAAAAQCPWRALAWLADMTDREELCVAFAHPGPPCDIYRIRGPAGLVGEMHVSRDPRAIAMFYFRDGWPHREDGPAVAVYEVLGRPLLRYYLRDGYFLEENGEPRAYSYHDNGRVTIVSYPLTGRLGLHPWL